MSNRHAYLIMAHHRPDLLQRLVSAIDDERNDIFIHLDKKSNINSDEISAERSGLFFIPRISVNWGGYSQIECTMRLLKAASSNEEYAYYHLMTGVSYPLRNQDELHDFFDAHQGREFIQVDSMNCRERVQCFWFFNEAGKVDRDIRLDIFRHGLARVQKKLGIDLFKKYNLETCKGLAYWSITHDFASYIISKGDLVEQMMKHSICGDEMFIHILGYNSKFRDRFYRDEDGMWTSLRFSTWGIEEDKGKAREGHNFEMEDIPDILGSNALFALKFEGPDGPQIIDAINKERNIITGR